MSALGFTSLPQIGMGTANELLALTQRNASATSAPAAADISSNPFSMSSIFQKGENILSGALEQGAAKATQSIFSQDVVVRIVTGLLGLMLIAAGIFSFRAVHETIIEGGKAAGKAAAVAA